ncbi:microcystin degradation protein MlrC [Trinickia dabaoshanensis]|uniref:Microcystinase C n=1 Tax=Trinickia dabaoshanensis TaxID=564714 RepID=A0A2N7VCN8_9BURK|nr:M81 family metallopeptidase [Trinickia dabaoshanensis]PMS14916.1 microcystin degradation protein MlrC [Trinickia dabaoshanensis]
MKIYIAGFQHETNTFVETPAGYEAFNEAFGPVRRGEAVNQLISLNVPIGGFLSAIKETDHEIIPGVWAVATPSGRVTKDAYERIVGEILDGIRHAEADAVYLDLHGAMVAEHFDDGEGELLRRVREIVGPAIPVIASLDLHANVTQCMLEQSDGLVAYRTYPHVDMAEAGRRAARLLYSRIDAGGQWRKYARRVPFLIPINAMCTDAEPSRGLYAQLESLEHGAVASLSFTPGFPAADFPECGPLVFGYGTDADELSRVVDALHERVVSNERDWSIAFLSADEAVVESMRLSQEADRPVIIADTQDNPGAGAASNATDLLRALVMHGAQRAAVGLFWDPDAVEIAHRAGTGASVELALGTASGNPFSGRFVVEALSTGRCECDGPMLKGVTVELGRTACLRIDDVRVVVTSNRMQIMDRALYRVAGVVPEEMKILVNKSSVHFRADFEPIAQAVLIAKSDGSMAADPADLPWTALGDGMRVSPGGPRFERGKRHGDATNRCA